MPNAYKLFLVDVHTQADVWVLERMFKNRGVDLVDLVRVGDNGTATCKVLFDDESGRDTINEIMESTRSCGGMCSGFRKIN